MKVSIEVNCECELWSKFLFDAEKVLTEATKKVMERVEATTCVNSVEISILLTNDESIRILNNDYRGKDSPTNVLSFPSEFYNPGEYSDIDDDLILGDLAFSYEIIQKEAKEQKKSFKEHFSHLAVHGILHLLGYDHINDDDADKMEGIEIVVLEAMGIKNPYEY
jgi:probable rRNA maturation factor